MPKTLLNRMASRSAFWNDRYETDAFVYGTAPNAFVKEAADRWLAEPSEILDLGAGEGRNTVFLAVRGHAVTAVDFSSAGLQKVERLAADAGVAVDARRADVTTWQPDRTWDAVVVTFLHLAPSDQARLYRLIRDALRPGGVFIAEWFRPEQITGGYDSGGPPDIEKMVAPDDLRKAFPEAGIEHLEAGHPHLDEGPHHAGEGATVRFVWRRPNSD